MLLAYLDQSPYRGRGEPRVTLWPAGDRGEAAEVGLTELDGVIARVAEYLGRLQGMRAEMARLLAA